MLNFQNKLFGEIRKGQLTFYALTHLSSVVFAN